VQEQEEAAHTPAGNGSLNASCMQQIPVPTGTSRYGIRTVYTRATFLQLPTKKTPVLQQAVPEGLPALDTVTISAFSATGWRAGTGRFNTSPRI